MGTTEVKALDGVSISVNEGEFVAIQGTSGSGKSTLLNMIGGLDHPTSGEVLFDSKPLGPFSKKEMARYRRFSVGMIFQNFNLIPTMTAAENVSLALAFGGLRGPERRLEEYRTLTLKVFPTVSDLKLVVRATHELHQMAAKGFPAYTSGALIAGQWNSIQVPMTAFGQGIFNAVRLIGSGAGATSRFYVDDVLLN